MAAMAKLAVGSIPQITADLFPRSQLSLLGLVRIQLQSGDFYLHLVFVQLVALIFITNLQAKGGTVKPLLLHHLQLCRERLGRTADVVGSAA